MLGNSWKSNVSDRKLTKYTSFCEEVKELDKSYFNDILPWLFFCFAKRHIPIMCKVIREQRQKIDYLEKELRLKGAIPDTIRIEAEKFMCQTVKDVL